MPNPNTVGESDSNSSEIQIPFSDSTRPTGVTLAGRIVSVDDNSIVLADAVAILWRCECIRRCVTLGVPRADEILA